MLVDTETWLPIAGYEETYLVSSTGRVWSSPRQGTRGGLVRQYRSRWGYMNVKLCRHGENRTVSVHILVGAAFLGPRPDGMETRHLDGDPTNNSVGNLRYGSKSENAQDRILHGHHEQLSKTHCPQGHAYAGVNLRRTPDGHQRYCLTCKREKKRAYDRRRRLLISA